MSQVLLLTSGTRGDVEPFVVLGVELARRGHRARVCTHARFRPLVEDHGLAFAPLNDGLLELGDRTGTGTSNPVALIGEARRILGRTLAEAWDAARGSDLVVHHPKTLAGTSLAESLRIPAILTVMVPMLAPTRAFAHPLLGGRDLGPFNHASHAVDRLIAAPYRGVVNRWRKEHDLPPLGPFPRLDRMSDGRLTPILVPASPALVPRPADWPERIHLTGFLFSDGAGDGASSLDPALDAFLESGPPPIFFGFGSMTGGDAEARTRAVVAAAGRVGLRAVIATGWGGLVRPAADAATDRIHVVEGAPFDLLFPRVAAVVHHGGAGTTAAGLKAGRPTLVCPFFGDQAFWGAAVAARGAGPEPIRQARLDEGRLARALEALLDPQVGARAAALGERIRSERGLERAVDLLEATMPARS